MLNILEIGGISDMKDMKLIDNNLNEVFKIFKRYICKVSSFKARIKQLKYVVLLVKELLKILRRI